MEMTKKTTGNSEKFSLYDIIKYTIAYKNNLTRRRIWWIKEDLSLLTQYKLIVVNKILQIIENSQISEPLKKKQIAEFLHAPANSDWYGFYPDSTHADVLKARRMRPITFVFLQIMILITFPISVPLLALWSWNKNRNFFFLKTRGEFLVERLIAFSENEEKNLNISDACPTTNDQEKNIEYPVETSPDNLLYTLQNEPYEAYMRKRLPEARKNKITEEDIKERQCIRSVYALLRGFKFSPDPHNPNKILFTIKLWLPTENIPWGILTIPIYHAKGLPTNYRPFMPFRKQSKDWHTLDSLNTYEGAFTGDGATGNSFAAESFKMLHAPEEKPQEKKNIFIHAANLLGHGAKKIQNFLHNAIQYSDAETSFLVAFDEEKIREKEFERLLEEIKNKPLITPNNSMLRRLLIISHEDPVKKRTLLKTLMANSRRAVLKSNFGCVILFETVYNLAQNDEERVGIVKFFVDVSATLNGRLYYLSRSYGDRYSKARHNDFINRALCFLPKNYRSHCPEAKELEEIFNDVFEAIKKEDLKTAWEHFKPCSAKKPSHFLRLAFPHLFGLYYQYKALFLTFNLHHDPENQSHEEYIHPSASDEALLKLYNCLSISSFMFKRCDMRMGSEYEQETSIKIKKLCEMAEEALNAYDGEVCNIPPEEYHNFPPSYFLSWQSTYDMHAYDFLWAAFESLQTAFESADEKFEVLRPFFLHTFDKNPSKICNIKTLLDFQAGIPLFQDYKENICSEEAKPLSRAMVAMEEWVIPSLWHFCVERISKTGIKKPESAILNMIQEAICHATPIRDPQTRQMVAFILYEAFAHMTQVTLRVYDARTGQYTDYNPGNREKTIVKVLKIEKEEGIEYHSFASPEKLAQLLSRNSAWINTTSFMQLQLFPQIEASRSAEDKPTKPTIPENSPSPTI